MILLQQPFLNNQGEAYYSIIVCNKSKGSSPKSKVNKIKKSMLNKEKYDPIDAHLGLPTIETFYKRILKVKLLLNMHQCFFKLNLSFRNFFIVIT